MQDKLNIIIADDHPLFRNALRQALSSSFTNTTWYEADSSDSLQKLLDNSSINFDLVLLDLQMPGTHGYSCLIHLRSHFPTLPVVIISAHEDRVTISRAVKYGSLGFIPKSTQIDTLTVALEAVLDGDVWLPSNVELQDVPDDTVSIVAQKLAELTPQQYKVLNMFADGLLNKQIAYDLNVSEATIKAHATSIFKKLNVRNRTQAVITLKQLEMEKQDL